MSICSAGDGSAAAVSLPNDVIFDILSWTPVRSVCRFLCVSKGWRALISNPAFIAAHNSRAEPLIVASSICKDLKLMDMDGNVVRVFREIGGPVNLFTSLDRYISVVDRSVGARVIDPATGKVFVTFNRSFSYADIIYGFGQAAPFGAHKVVRLISSDHAAEVYNVEDRSGWTQRGAPPSNVCNQIQSSPVAVNGALYFMAAPAVQGDVLCFNLESEEWSKTIQGPQKSMSREVPNKTGVGIKIAELNGALCMAQPETRNTVNPCTNIWLLVEGIWFKAYTIPMATNSYLYVPLRVFGAGDKLLFHCRKSGRLVPQVYDPRTGTVINIKMMPGIWSNSIGLCKLHLDRFVRVLRM